MAATPKTKRSKRYQSPPWSYANKRVPRGESKLSFGETINAKKVPKSGVLVMDSIAPIGGAIGQRRPAFKVPTRSQKMTDGKTRMGPPSPRKPLNPKLEAPKGRVGGTVGYRAPTKQDKAKQMMALRHRLKDRG